MDNIKNDNLHFDVHASLLFHLGDQLITDEITAVSELIKNSYDADASYVKVDIDPEWINNNENIIGKIEIKDNGTGMNLEDVKNGWLTLAHSKKKMMKKEGQVTERFKRLPLGDKGLGRLSVQRLGNRITLITKKKNSMIELKVHINWQHFAKDVSLLGVDIRYETKEVSKSKKNKSYTSLIITDLKNVEKWRKSKNIDEFEDRISKIVSPFDFNRQFFISAKVGERILESPQVEKELLDAAVAKYNFKIEDGEISIKGRYRLEYFPQAAWTGDRLNEFVHLYKKDLSKINTYYIDKGTVVFEYNERIKLHSLGDLKLDFLPGNFSGCMYDYDLDSKTFNRFSQNNNLKHFNKLSNFRKYVKAYSGIKVFRDDFKIFPYGDDGNDWLGFGLESTSGKSYYSLKGPNVIGYIALKGLENKVLQEKTDREGFVEDEYSTNFFKICKYIVKNINSNRENLRRKYNKYIRQKDERKEARSNYIPTYKVAKNKIIEATDFADRTVQEVQRNILIINDATKTVDKVRKNVSGFKAKEDRSKVDKLLNTVQKLINDLEKRYEDISVNAVKLKEIRASSVSLVKQIEATMNQVEEIMEIAGLGLTAEILTHELFTLVNNTKEDAKMFRNYFRNNFEENIKVEAFLDSIITRTDTLRKQVSHLSPGFRRVRTNKEILDMKDVINEHIIHYESRGNRNGIRIINVNPLETFQIRANKGLLIQIFDNLYSNAEYWLLHAFENNLINKKDYYIEIFASGIIQVWDSGIGIDKSMEDRIFEPFITSKTDGRGLGLYLISSILENNNCNIRLMEPINQFGNRYKFSLDFLSILLEGE